MAPESPSALDQVVASPLRRPDPGRFRRSGRELVSDYDIDLDLPGAPGFELVIFARIGTRDEPLHHVRTSEGWGNRRCIMPQEPESMHEWNEQEHGGWQLGYDCQSWGCRFPSWFA
jgi:hypothetical protein